MVEGMDWRAPADLQEVAGFGSSCEIEAPEGSDWQAPAHINKMPDPIYDHVLASLTRFLDVQERLLGSVEDWKTSADLVPEKAGESVDLQRLGCFEKAEEVPSERSTAIASPNTPSSPISTRRSAEEVQHRDSANSQASSSASSSSSPSMPLPVTGGALKNTPYRCTLPDLIANLESEQSANDVTKIWCAEYLATTIAEKKELEEKIEALISKVDGEISKPAMQQFAATRSSIATSTPSTSLVSGSSQMSRDRTSQDGISSQVYALSRCPSASPKLPAAQSPFLIPSRLVAEMAKGPASVSLPVGKCRTKLAACLDRMTIDTRLVVRDHQFIRPATDCRLVVPDHQFLRPATELQQTGTPLCKLLRTPTPLQVPSQRTCT